MVIEIHNQLCYVSDASAAEYALLSRILTHDGDNKFILDWKTRKFKFNPNFTRICLLEDSGFPTGLLGVVVSKLREAGHTVTIEDQRVKPANADQSLLPQELQLRPYQLEALQAALKSGRGIIDLATGAGKSRLALAIMSCVPVKWLYLAPKFNLVQQVASDFQKILNIKPGIIGDNRWSVGDITLATVSTLHARRDKPECRALLQSVGGIIADECHGAGSASYFGTLMSSPAYYRIGLSATPKDRSDDRTIKVIGSLGRVLYKQSLSDLIDEGYLAKPKIIMHRYAQTFSAVNVTVGMNLGILKSKGRAKKILDVASTMQFPALIFVKRKMQGAAIEAGLRARGIRCRFIYGVFSPTDRMRAIKDLEEDTLDVIVTNVFNEGIDIPKLRSGFAAGGGKSTIQVLQWLGRLTRLSEGKLDFEFHDILDECLDDSTECGNRWNADHARARIKSYQSNDLDVEIK